MHSHLSQYTKHLTAYCTMYWYVINKILILIYYSFLGVHCLKQVLTKTDHF